MAVSDFDAQGIQFVTEVKTVAPSVARTQAFMRRRLSNADGDNWARAPYLFPMPARLVNPPSTKPDDYDRIGFVAALRTHDWRFICVEPDGQVVANRRAANLYETLLVVQVDQNRVAFQSRFTALWICAEPDGRVVCNRPVRSTWETFLVKDGAVPGSYGFCSEVHNHYHLCAEPDGRLACNRPWMSDWEQFRFAETPRDTVEAIRRAQFIPTKDEIERMYGRRPRRP
jgi:hypothetical protein